MYIRGDIYIFIGQRFPLPPGEGVGGLPFFQKIPRSKGKQAPSGKSPPGKTPSTPDDFCRMVATFLRESQYPGVSIALSFLIGEKKPCGHHPRRQMASGLPPRQPSAGASILGSNYNWYLTIIFYTKHIWYPTIISTTQQVPNYTPDKRKGPAPAARPYL